MFSLGNGHGDTDDGTLPQNGPLHNPVEVLYAWNWIVEGRLHQWKGYIFQRRDDLLSSDSEE
ncbi:hypothetical protein BCON_0223g00050 [Botryotinia convoluta]|uniref:Uncharacterized protein n=1 Tax=Botryotinia convoluta TaxID=54673 RepID=A0A4Z1HW72_9HELO|nr:hypothetical protein BCON_0223g00050 [Botryotinia convoluta]